MKYDRKILVPYLKNVQEIEMICVILSKRLNDISRDINSVNNNIVQEKNFVNNYSVKQKKKSIIKYIFNDSFAMRFLLAVVFGVISLIVGFVLDFNKYDTLKWVFYLLGILIWFIGFFTSILSIKDEYRETKMFNQQELIKYNQMIERKEREEKEYKDKLHVLINNENIIKKDLEEAKAKKNQIYSANIIAIQYRDVYSATYLYRYFSTSREDDLDKVIQTLLLDNIQNTIKEIKEEIISLNNSFVAMNNYLNNISNGVSELNKTSLDIQNEIAKVEKNADLQMDYLNMIECNTKASAYFSAATYLNSFK